MKAIKDLSAAITLFKEAAAKQAQGTEIGNSKMANRNYDILINIINYLKQNDSLDKLLELLEDQNVGVRIWAAAYLLPIHEKEATMVLKEIEKGSDIHSLDAETTLSEWRRGNIKF